MQKVQVESRILDCVEPTKSGAIMALVAFKSWYIYVRQLSSLNFEEHSFSKCKFLRYCFIFGESTPNNQLEYNWETRNFTEASS